jgi:Uma2 family endonuclease
MATSTAISVEQYLRTYYDPDMEYVDGQLVERHVGEYFHSRLQFLIAQALGSRERERRYRVFTEQRVFISDEPRYRIPDICVKALPHQVTSVLTAPDLAIEVVSPDDAASDLLLRVVDFHQGGIPYVWIVDPYKRVLVDSVNGRVRRPAEQVLSTPLVGDVDFADLFAQLDEPAE